MSDKYDVLGELAKIPWKSIAKTFGNCHSTLIGAVVQQWNDPEKNRFALEPGCSSGCKPKEGRFRICDAILCEGDPIAPCPKGILEVEANVPTFFDRGRFDTYVGAKEEKLQFFNQLEFLLFVAYDYRAVGGRRDPKVQKAFQEEDHIIVPATKLVGKHGVRFFAVIVRKRHADRLSDGGFYAEPSIRQRNEYYPCTISCVKGFEVTPCGKGGERTYYSHPRCQGVLK